MFIQSSWTASYEKAQMLANLHDGWIETHVENSITMYRAIWEIPLSSVN